MARFQKLEQDLQSIEAEFAQPDASIEVFEQAVSRLSALAEDAEEYVDKNCTPSKNVQYFSFDNLFERLAYKRIEKDPRELHDVGEPLDRLYADLAYALIHTQEYDRARAALAEAIRWNPMNCAYRLDLAELNRVQGDMEGWIGMTYSVFSRAVHPAHLARAYANFSEHFMALNKPEVALACVYLANTFDSVAHGLEAAIHALAGKGFSLENMDKEQASALVEAEGLPDGANAEIAVCLLMCATDCAKADNKKLAYSFTMQARDLVGEKACAALLELILESDA